MAVWAMIYGLCPITFLAPPGFDLKFSFSDYPWSPIVSARFHVLHCAFWPRFSSSAFFASSYVSHQPLVIAFADKGGGSDQAKSCAARQQGYEETHIEGVYALSSLLNLNRRTAVATPPGRVSHRDLIGEIDAILRRDYHFRDQQDFASHILGVVPLPTLLKEEDYRRIFTTVPFDIVHSPVITPEPPPRPVNEAPFTPSCLEEVVQPRFWSFLEEQLAINRADAVHARANNSSHRRRQVDHIDADGTEWLMPEARGWVWDLRGIVPVPVQQELIVNDFDAEAIIVLAQSFGYSDLELFQHLRYGIESAPDLPQVSVIAGPLKSAMDAYDIVASQIDDDIRNGFMLPCPSQQLSPCGAALPYFPARFVPTGSATKKYTDPPKHRKTCVFPHPWDCGLAVNDNVDRSLMRDDVEWGSMQSFAVAVCILHFVYGEVWISKIDISAAYRRWAVSAPSRWQQYSMFGGEAYIDHRLTFGNRIAGHMYQRLSTLWVCVFREMGKKLSQEFHCSRAQTWRRSRLEVFNDELQALLFFIMAFLDDYCFAFPSLEFGVSAIDSFAATIEGCGMQINAEKAAKEKYPRQIQDILGFVMNTQTMTFTLSSEKRGRIRLRAEGARSAYNESAKTMPKQDLDSLLGHLQQIAQLFPDFKMYLTSGFACLKSARVGRCRISKQFRDDLDVFLKLLSRWSGVSSFHFVANLLPAFRPLLLLNAFSDASGGLRGGFGAVCGPFYFYGRWTAEESAVLHINTLELIANIFMLEIFAFIFRGCTVPSFIDNTVAQAASGNRTKTRVNAFTMRRKHVVLAANGIREDMSRVSTERNGISDAASRGDIERMTALLGKQGITNLTQLTLPSAIRDISDIVAYALSLSQV
jgi:hypothetical protein